MSLLEYQAKNILSEYGVNVQKFIVRSDESAANYPTSLSSDSYIIKAQIAAGGRGKGMFPELAGSSIKSGIQFSRSFEEAVNIADAMNGKALVTAQTPSQGEIVRQVMIAEAIPQLQNEGYLALTLKDTGPVILCSAQGGVDIENVPRGEIFEFPIDSIEQEEVIKRIFPNETSQEIIQTGVEQMKRLLKCFFEKDLTLLEVNPFAITPEGKLICIDAKIEIDDNALFRHEHFKKLTQGKPNDNFVKLDDGNLGIVVNGAGLAMATMDLAKLHGARPANFLDLGGKATTESIAKAIQKVACGKNVASILVNIFGGIVRCDEVAMGILESQIDIPIVARLCGIKITLYRRNE